MTTLPLYQIDAFADKPFSGNPAAVCPLESWLPDPVLQSIAEENNLSETAFFVTCDDGYHIRWFTPVDEVDLCGHATLATAYVIFNELGDSTSELTFASRSGTLRVRRQGGLLELDFPSQPPEPCDIPDAIARSFNNIEQCLAGEDYMVVLGSQDEVIQAAPDFQALATLDRRGVIVTAEGEDVDFVSRFFVPKLGINEDPVTGSAHTQLTPYWAGQTGKAELRARQVSKRGGDLICRLNGDRVHIAGRAVKYLTGQISISTS